MLRCNQPLQVVVGAVLGTIVWASESLALREVPGTYSTLDLALAAASAVDTIVITQAGSYPGFTSPTDKTLLVHSTLENPPIVTGRTHFRRGTLRNLKLVGDYGTDWRTLQLSNGVSESVTIENCTIESDEDEEDTQGIVAYDGPLTIKNTIVQGVGYAIHPAYPGSVSDIRVEDSRFVSQHGVFMDSQSLEMHRSTLSGTGIAVYGGDITKVVQCIIEGFATVFGFSCPTDSVYYNVIHGYTTLGCTLNGTNNLLATDPLFCESRESLVGEYSLRIDSPAIATNNAWGKPVGKTSGVECAWGTLARDATVASGSTITVLEDLIVPTGKVLTVNSGVTFKADDDDNSSSGTSAAENEIRVSGKMIVAGTNGSKAHFKSTAGSPAAGDWFGIDVLSGGDLRMEFGKVTHATYGVRASTSDTVTVEKCVFDDNLSADIYTASSPALLTISRNVLTPDNIGIDLRNTDFSTTTVSHNKITGCSTAVAGIQVFGPGEPTGSASVTTDTVTAFSTGAAIWIKNSSSIFTNNRITDNKYGFHVQGGTAAIGTSSSSSDNVLIDNTRGVFCEGTGPSTCNTTVAPVIRNNLLQSNTYGVVTEKTASPDLGTGSGDKGLNSFISNDTYCIWNRANSSCGSISAYGNYYGECEEGQPPICYDGLVNLGTSECTQPSAFRRGFIDVTPAIDAAARPLTITSLSPNPARGPVVVAFRVGGAVEREVRAEVFDVSGRLVRSIGGALLPSGIHELVWDGRGDHEQAVPDGMYFVRLRLPDGTVEAAKVLVVR
jgi:hypothetical protein